MSNVRERMRRDEELRRAWLILENQRRMIGALNDAAGCSDGTDPWYDSLCNLRIRVAHELYLSCQRIWAESAHEGEEALNV